MAGTHRDDQHGHLFATTLEGNIFRIAHGLTL